MRLCVYHNHDHHHHHDFITRSHLSNNYLHFYAGKCKGIHVSLARYASFYVFCSKLWNDNGLLACYRLTHVCIACHHHHCQLFSSHHHSYVLMRFPTMTTTNFYHDDDYDKSISAPAD